MVAIRAARSNSKPAGRDAKDPKAGELERLVPKPVTLEGRASLMVRTPVELDDKSLLLPNYVDLLTFDPDIGGRDRKTLLLAPSQKLALEFRAGHVR